MREILFRGKRMDGKGWVEGWYYQLKRSEKIVHYIVENPLPKLVGVKEYEVYPTTVGQFTGLLDKNGKKIFEGDIVMYGDKTASVVFHDSEFSLNFPDNKYIQHGLLTPKSFSPIAVIGNLHDNPELLK